MSRAEIRRQQREERKGKAVMQLTRDQVMEIVVKAVEKHGEEVAGKLTEKNFIVMLGLSCWTLHDIFGFGKDRLTRFIDNALTKYECMIEDYDKRRKDGYDFDTAVRLLKEETGFDLEDIMRKRRVIR